MFERFASLGDRMLSRLVPAASAQASTYFRRWEGCGYNACLARRCCYVSGISGPVSCTRCTYTC